MSAERDALAPCPFCGSDNIQRADERPGMSWYWIKCDGCGAGFDEVYPDQAAADALWNRRALEVSAEGAPQAPTDEPWSLHGDALVHRHGDRGPFRQEQRLLVAGTKVFIAETMKESSNG